MEDRTTFMEDATRENGLNNCSDCFWFLIRCFEYLDTLVNSLRRLVNEPSIGIPNCRSMLSYANGDNIK